MGSMKEESIRNYILSVDFNRDDWKLSQIKEEMRKFLGEDLDDKFKKLQFLID